MLDGKVFGEATFKTSWEGNAEYLQVGGNGWASGTGEAGFNHAFKGTLSDIVVIEGLRSYDAIQEMLAGTSPDPQPRPDPNPQPDPADVPVFFLQGAHEIDSAADVLEYAHDAALELSSATAMLTFTANNVDGRFGLLSKDASRYEGGGNHFTSYIDDGKLVVRFQDGQTSKVFKVNVEADTAYDLQISFGDGVVTAMLNGSVFGSANFETSWETNLEHLQVGANGWASDSGKAGFNHVFDGTISNVILVEGRKSPAEMEALKGAYAATSQHDAITDNDLLYALDIQPVHSGVAGPARAPEPYEEEVTSDLLAGAALAPEQDYFTS